MLQSAHEVGVTGSDQNTSLDDWALSGRIHRNQHSLSARPFGGSVPCTAFQRPDCHSALSSLLVKFCPH